MRNVLNIFKGDLGRLFRNPITVIVAICLIVLPSIFSWYNMLACWNVFDNTGNLTVAVANSDEGYESDLVSLKLNLGDRVVSALRENDQLDWVFTDEEDAVDGVSAGRYYAAVVIPKTFSKDLMSFYSDDIEHAKITYYSNEKKSAIAPKITDQGADRVSAQVNEAFAETLSEIALSLSQSLVDSFENGSIARNIGDLARHISTMGEEMADFAELLREWSSLLGAAQSLVTDAEGLIAQVGTAATDAKADVAAMTGTLQDMKNATAGSSAALSAALTRCVDGLGAVPASIDAAAEAAAGAAENAAAPLRDAASAIDGQAANLRTVRDLIDGIERRVAEQGLPSSGKLVTLLDEALAKLSSLSAKLNEAADALSNSGTVARTARDEAKRLANEAVASLQGAKAEFESRLAPVIDGLAAKADSVKAALDGSTGVLSGMEGALGTSAGSVTDAIAAARQKIDAAANDVDAAAQKLASVGNTVSQAIQNDDLASVRSLLASDPAALAAAITSPVDIDRRPVYEVENFGSAMAPLYTTLALWIGSLLLMVAISVTPTKRTLAELPGITARQVFLGRFGVIALLSLMQSTLLSCGNMLLLGAQVTYPFLYLLCFWVSGLSFSFIIYTLVALMGNLGKALGVVLLIVQVAGGGGSFPLGLLPGFFQTLSPWLPITHSVNAMRAAMFGIYGGDFWIEMGTVVLFAIPPLIIGFVLIKPLYKVVRKFIARVEESELM